MLEIRPATEGDAAEIRGIYAPYVVETAITFEYEVPGVEEMAARIRRTLSRYPYLCAVEGGKVVGYAYAGAFKDRAAYIPSAELSVYVAGGMRGRGIGRALYAELEAELRARGVVNAYACVAVPTDKADARLTDASVRFHERLGFRVVGRFTDCATKFGRWYSMAWLGKVIGERG